MIYWGMRRKKWVLQPGRLKQIAVLTVCGSKYLLLDFLNSKFSSDSSCISLI